MAKGVMTCELEHERPRRAAIRVEIKSSRASSPGRPMIREVTLCAEHARQLRQIGLEIVPT
jgi:hypothetical protein